MRIHWIDYLVCSTTLYTIPYASTDYMKLLHALFLGHCLLSSLCNGLFTTWPLVFKRNTILRNVSKNLNTESANTNRWFTQGIVSGLSCSHLHTAGHYLSLRRMQALPTNIIENYNCIITKYHNRNQCARRIPWRKNYTCKKRPQNISLLGRNTGFCLNALRRQWALVTKRRYKKATEF